jgi:hypothetical protein
VLEAQTFHFMISFSIVELVVVSDSPRHLPAVRGLSYASRVKKNVAELGDKRPTHGGP